MQSCFLTKGAPPIVASLILSGTALAADSLTVTVQGTPANKAAYGKVIPKFEAQSGIKVDVEYVGGNYGAVVTTQLQGSNAPDIVQLVPGGSVPHSVLNVAEAGRLADLSAAPWINRISETTLPLVSSGDEVYAWAATVQVSGLIVNEDILSENDLEAPKTLDDLYALCGALRQKGYVPIGWTGTPESRSAGQATTVAGSVGATATAVNEPLNKAEANYAESPEWRKVMGTIEAMHDAGCFDPETATNSDSQAAGMVLRGDAAMMMNNTQMLGVVLANDTTGNLNLKVHAFPGETEADSHVVITPYDALAVTAASEAKDEAIKFLDFLSQPEIQREVASAVGNIAPVDAQEGTLPDTLAALKPYFDSGRIEINPVMFWRGGRLYITMSKGVQGLITGQLKAADVLADMDRVNHER